MAPVLQTKFDKELIDLKALHKDIMKKVKERHEHERELSNKEYEEKQRLKEIRRSVAEKEEKDKIKDRGDDYDDY